LPLVRHHTVNQAVVRLAGAKFAAVLEAWSKFVNRLCAGCLEVNSVMIERSGKSRPRLIGQLSAVALLVVAVSGPLVAQQAPPPKSAPQGSQVTPQVLPPAPGPVGIWIDHTGRGAVEIQPCGAGLCGRIVWIQQPLDTSGQPLRDKLNENRRLRNRPICGIQIIGDLKPMRDGSWDRGWIYDPEQGESFDVELRLRAPDVLQVTGYKGLKFLSETFQWRRVSELPAPPCPAADPV